MTAEELFDQLKTIVEQGQGDLPVVNADDIHYSSLEVSDDPYPAVVLE